MPLLLVSFLAAVGMAASVLALVRPHGAVEIGARAALGTALASLIATASGVALKAETAEFLLAASFATAPIIVLLGAAANDAAPGRRGIARLLVGAWAIVVFPAVLVCAPLLWRLCGEPACRVEDFGAGLALLVSSAASVILAGRVVSTATPLSPLRFLVPVLALWASSAVWLASLEGAIDDYTGRILVASVLAPVGGAIAWTLVDLARGRRHPVRSVADGLMAGLVAIVPGAATIPAPWSLVVGAIAGAAAALVFGARRLDRAGGAGHWALVVLTSTAVGFLAPAVAGDTIGLLVSGRMSALLPPLAEFLGVTALGVVVSIPAWLLARRARAASGDDEPPA